MDYEAVREDIKTAITGLDNEISTAEGTVVDLVVSGCAVPIAGTRGYAESVAQSVYPDKADYTSLLHHAVLKRIANPESYDEPVLRKMVCDLWAYPTTGSSFSDWGNIVGENCSQGSEKRFFVVELGRGQGSVDCVLGYGASVDQLEALRILIQSRRMFCFADVQCSIAVRRTIEIRMEITGKSVDSDAVRREIVGQYGEDSSFRPAQSIYSSRIESIGVQYGADRAEMFWRNSGDSEWIRGDSIMIQTFVNRMSVYEHLVVGSAYVEVV